MPDAPRPLPAPDHSVPDHSEPIPAPTSRSARPDPAPQPAAHSAAPAVSTPSIDAERIPSFPEPTLEVRPWSDPVLDELGHDPRSAYVERFWVSVLGPCSILLLRRLAAGLDVSPDGFDVDTVEIARELGLGQRGGRNGPFWKTLDRTCRFGVTSRSGPVLRVRRKMAPLTLRQIERLPRHLALAHARWLDPAGDAGLDPFQPLRRSEPHRPEAA